MSCNCKKDPCDKGCQPAQYGCEFNILADPYDTSYWNVSMNGALHKVKIPKLNETDTKLSANFSNGTLIYNAERHTDIIKGSQIGELINLDDLRDVEVPNADSCDLLVFDPGCAKCGDECKPNPAMWRNYHIPDAGDCEIEADDDGFYHVLIKDNCGCIRECKLPVFPKDFTTINYVRDSVPDDPDFPWYYGMYNDKINLRLADNAKKWFGKYPLKITVHYGIQVLHSSAAKNTNYRSLVTPVVEGTQPNVTMFSSIIQGQSTVSLNTPIIPWGSVSQRGSLTFVVPKGKECYLHHEFRLRGESDPLHYWHHALDGQKVPDEIAGQVDKMVHTASRLNALEVVVEPANGTVNTQPVVDPYRNQLDPADDIYPPISG